MIRLAGLVGLYAAFVVYGSLVPLEYRPLPPGEAWARFQQIPYLNLGVGSRADWVANGVLYVPLGFLLLLVAFLLPSAAPLLGMFAFGNLMKECGVVDRLSDTTQNALINIVTIFLGLAIGSKLSAEQFLVPSTLGILSLGMVAFAIGTASGVLMAKLMNRFSSTPINPLIGAAGVSAVPMAARVANKLGLEANSQNFLLMHAMGPNVAGVIGSAVAAGIMILFAGQ